MSFMIIIMMEMMMIMTMIVKMPGDDGSASFVSILTKLAKALWWATTHTCLCNFKYFQIITAVGAAGL